MSHAHHSSTSSGEPTASDPSVETDSTATSDDPAGARRDVVVPLRIYKAVTVFSTLFAIAAIVAGFLALDAATNRATVDLSQVDPLLALGGLGAIGAGAAVYAFSTRFRTAGMRPAGGAEDG